jgi:sporulation protein YlmC with PRC-barrel domain
MAGPGRADPDHHLAGTRHRIRYLQEFGFASETHHPQCSHSASRPCFGKVHPARLDYILPRLNPAGGVGTDEYGMLWAVLLLTRVLGRMVLGPDGEAVGRLTDLIVGLSNSCEPQLVDRLVVSRRHAPALVLPWDLVSDIRTGRVVLAATGTELADFETASPAEVLAHDEILLHRDVLDTQVVDVAGQRLARVADVVLALAGGAGGAGMAGGAGRTGLEVVGVEVGFGAVLRRLGLRRVTPVRTEDVVAWSDLHLTSERGHTVQLAAARSAVHRLDVRGLAALVSRVDTDSASEILAAKDPQAAAAVVAEAHPEIGERMLRAMLPSQADRIVAAMPTAHARRWRDRLGRPALLGRRFGRSRVSSRRHLNWRRP